MRRWWAAPPARPSAASIPGRSRSAGAARTTGRSGARRAWRARRSSRPSGRAPCTGRPDTDIRSIRPKLMRAIEDSALLDTVQRQTLRYFWEFAHPAYGLETVTTGGSGFGVMAIVVGVERGWIERGAAVVRLLHSLRFLAAADSYHGVFPHFLNGDTGRTKPF